MRRTEQSDVRPVQPPPIRRLPARLRWSARFLDGVHPWGSFDAMISRYGVRRYRLTVYPPGTSALDRRLARLWRGWPVSGAVLGLLEVMLLSSTRMPPHTVFTVAVGSYLGIGTLLYLRAGPARVRIKSLSVVLDTDDSDAHERWMYTECQLLGHTLVRADRRVSSGEMSSIDYEATWWEAYESLGMLTAR